MAIVRSYGRDSIENIRRITQRPDFVSARFVRVPRCIGCGEPIVEMLANGQPRLHGEHEIINGYSKWETWFIYASTRHLHEACTSDVARALVMAQREHQRVMSGPCACGACRVVRAARALEARGWKLPRRNGKGMD